MLIRFRAVSEKCNVTPEKQYNNVVIKGDELNGEEEGNVEKVGLYSQCKLNWLGSVVWAFANG